MKSQQPYDPASFESRWQQDWEASGIYHTAPAADRPKFYCLDYFPYPSGAGLHVGHCRNYVPTDVISRYYRMRGNNVLHPMGWDAFGEPTEQYAIRHGIHPRATTDRNTANFKRQLQLIGTSYDWSREIDSSNPEYYQWTQWMFVRMFRRGLVYRDLNWQWWCPGCATTLSSHEIHGDRCWRGHTGITKKQIPAWYFRITAYADELIQGLDTVDWPEPIKTMQINWIGRSEGAEINFTAREADHVVSVFTTRPDTLFGATFLVLAPEHDLVDTFTIPEQTGAVQAYRAAALQRSEIERTGMNRVITGVPTGGFVRHPLSGSSIPVWIADYVLPTYGTGAVMGVPAHDARDFEFARQYGLPIKPVVFAANIDPSTGGISAAYEGDGVLGNSGRFDGLDNHTATRAIVEALVENGQGCAMVQYRMRDWLISRQRYWGTPIPIVYCDQCGTVPVPDDQLPVRLPPMAEFEPDGSGRSPLARVPEFVHTECPDCGGAAVRETDTMGGFACSSWYFLRFTSPSYAQGPFKPEAVAYWMPVDLYVGGAEHAVLHLLYARFWTKVLADEGLLPFREPFDRLINQGQLRGLDGTRMSKTRGNVVTPDELVAAYGADALRLHVMFMAPFEYDVDWSADGLRGTYRFLSRLWDMYQQTYTPSAATAAEDPELYRALQQAIPELAERIENFRFNTMVSGLMEFANLLFERWHAGRWETRTFHHALEVFLVLLAPGAPYLTEELWRRTGHTGSIHSQPWPEYEADLAAAAVVEIPVQVDGRVRAVLEVSDQWHSEQVEAAVRTNPAVLRALDGREIARVIYVAGKIVNVVSRVK
ncbi:MAG: leucine--tRNA ligase [Anaerolineales bacterium]